MRRKLAAGNWKMNGTTASLVEIEKLLETHPDPACEMLICPPATLIAQVAWRCRNKHLRIGGQDCHWNAAGAHTGDISAAMLADAGAAYVILGHSERRTDHAETDAMVQVKTQAAWAAGLIAVVCVGETERQRDLGATLPVIGGQLETSLPAGCTAANLVVAYEPVWAIGTGRTPTLGEIAEVHDYIRATLVARFGDEGTGVRILYGGSVKPSNAAEIFAVSNVDGALVGGASLKAADFGAIVDALAAA